MPTFVKSYKKAGRVVRSYLRSGQTAKIISVRKTSEGHIMQVREVWKGKNAGKIGVAGNQFYSTRRGALKHAARYSKGLRNIGYKKVK
jgi:hypothetical protein